MKQSLLIQVSAMLICGTAMAQRSSVPNVPLKNKALMNKAVKVSRYEADYGIVTGTTTGTTTPQQRSITLSTLGTSNYQLQTNNAVQNRIVANSDGTISAAFTFSNVAEPWADRGTGYVYFNGSSWSVAPTARIEGSTRTGWPSMMVQGDGRERVITHNTTGNNLYFSSRPVKGTGTWTHNGTIIASAAPYGNFWPRAVVGGNADGSIHLISISNPTDGAATPTAVYYMGQQGCLTYCRSQDGGTTWDILHSVPTQHDASQYVGFSADSYAIDARGNTVAYVVGGKLNDLFLMKSTDNGSTWTKTMIMSFPIPFFVDQLTDLNGDSVIDTVDTNDGNVSLLIDENDDVHVWFGRMRILNDDSTDAQYSYFPGTAGLMYWNENMGASAPVMIAAMEDTDGDNAISISDWGSYFSSLTSQPSAGIDDNNTIHLTYSGIVEYTDFGDGKSYRNIYHMSSSDHGSTWTTPARINPDEFSEQVYCSVARNADPACVRMIYQIDVAPGHGVNNTSADYTNNSGITTDQIYACLDPSTGMAETTNLSEVLNMYPNPSNSNVTLTTVEKMERVDVYNSLGARVLSITPNSNNANLNVADLTSGLYMVSIKVNGKTVSKQLVKE